MFVRKRRIVNTLGQRLRYEPVGGILDILPTGNVEVSDHKPSQSLNVVSVSTPVDELQNVLVIASKLVTQPVLGAPTVLAEAQGLKFSPENVLRLTDLSGIEDVQDVDHSGIMWPPPPERLFPMIWAPGIPNADGLKSFMSTL